MPTREDILNIIRKHFKYLRKEYHVGRVGVFGSFARGDITPTSDVDVLISFTSPIGWEIVDVKDFLEEKIGRKVDVVCAGGLKPKVKKNIMEDIIFV